MTYIFLAFAIILSVGFLWWWVITPQPIAMTDEVIYGMSLNFISSATDSSRLTLRGLHDDLSATVTISRLSPGHESNYTVIVSGGPRPEALLESITEALRGDNSRAELIDGILRVDLDKENDGRLVRSFRHVLEGCLRCLKVVENGRCFAALRGKYDLEAYKNFMLKNR